MASQAERDRRKALVREVVDRKRQEEESRMPLSKDDLAALFDYLDLALTVGCDHSLSLTRTFLASRSLPEKRLFRGLVSTAVFATTRFSPMLKNHGQEKLDPPPNKSLQRTASPPAELNR